MTQRFSAEPTLQHLKNFQRATVDHAFAKLYLDPNPTRRFLVADEVGLGKTLVAKGVIARAIEHLQDDVQRLDVIYICSNSDIAAQNVARLNVSNQNTFARATRLTLLPLQVGDLEDNELNFISFTPGTTFNMGHRDGSMAERRVLYHMLTYRRRQRFRRGLRHLLQGRVGSLERWHCYLDSLNSTDIDPTIARQFRDRLYQNSTLLQELGTLVERYYDRRRSIPKDINGRRLALTGQLRKMLARCCLDALQPDLIILDEFQRFSELLRRDNATSELAHELFEYEGQEGEPPPRILLLSATPYRMYATSDEEGDHYADFVETLKFLANNQDHVVEAIQRDLRQLRVGMLGSTNAEVEERLAQTRSRLRANLMRLMCRTERVGLTAQHDAMLVEAPLDAKLVTSDLEQLRALGKIGDALNARGLVEYWKSSPYLLNFMKGYQIKTRFDEAIGVNLEVQKAVSSHRNTFLPTTRIRSLKPVDPGNLKLRSLITEIEEQQLWRLLWMPASLPYWQPAGEYKNVGSISKQLVFSSWSVVPDAIAAMTSYAVDRLMLQGRTDLHYQDVSALPRLLTYSRAEDGTPHAMSAFALFFPSPALAALLDPAVLERPDNGQAATPASARAAAKSLLNSHINALPVAHSREASDRGWFWQFIARLATPDDANIEYWCRNGMQLLDVGEQDAQVGLQAHQATFADQLQADDPLPKPPDGFEDILASVVLGGPGICALRALRRAAPALPWADPELLSAAALIANRLRSLFNAPEVTIMLQRHLSGNEPYWRRVLQYCVDGNLQAVLDEHVHVLGESLGISKYSDRERVTRIATEISDALSLRTTRVRADGVGARESTDINMRCRYAVRFGEAAEGDSEHHRKELVRTAFNSPFQPFILASTSVGQEGLDFHQWCHSVIHWNLPSNPVDLEQREGRVHRYKGYAVRKNVGRYSRSLDSENLPPFSDPWETMFDHAARQYGGNESGLRPYWIFETEGGDKIMRRLINQPLSIDMQRYARLQRNLALYRMAFGQPRQEDIIRYLETQYSAEDAERISQAWQISLAPGPLSYSD